MGKRKRLDLDDDWDLDDPTRLPPPRDEEGELLKRSKRAKKNTKRMGKRPKRKFSEAEQDIGFANPETDASAM